jgi:hypothetical protein
MDISPSFTFLLLTPQTDILTITLEPTSDNAVVFTLTFK